ncbi:MAG: metal ABC transporter substrate-binding protein [Rhodothermia bacterium]|nr:metal ABC transporter substrate-binding protein [Rhodothermia bacterium]
MLTKYWNMRWGRALLMIALMATMASVMSQRAAAQGALRVVTTLPDLESIAKHIGGDHVETFSIAAGFQNPHFVDPKPSFIRQLSRADLFVTVGLDLESGWVPPLLNSARNPGILQGAPGYVDASVNVPLLQTPTSVTREQGDIHVYGNPHYWLDPARGKIIAKNILDGLVRLQPENRSYFEGNLERFNEEMDMHIAEWLAQMEPYKGARIVAYHNSWPYLAERFGLDVVDFLEPKPGIPPTPSQLAKIIRLMSEEDIGVIIIEPYFKTDAADLVARKTNGEVVVLATSVGAEESIRTYFDLFDYNVDKLVESFGDPN